MFDELKKIQEEFQEKAKAEGSRAVCAAVREFLMGHPEVTKVRWEQYAPHFNDGEPCLFSVHDPEVQLALGDDWQSYWDLPKGQLNDDVMELGKHLRSVEEVLRFAFGSDSQVVVTREGIEVETDFEHK